jgi:hypothetical protein
MKPKPQFDRLGKTIIQKCFRLGDKDKSVIPDLLNNKNKVIGSEVKMYQPCLCRRKYGIDIQRFQPFTKYYDFG